MCITRFACEAGTPYKSKDEEMPNIEQKNLSGYIGKSAGAVEGNLLRSRRRVTTGGLCSVYRDKIIAVFRELYRVAAIGECFVYGISVNIPSLVITIEPGIVGPSATLLGPTVMVKVGRTAISVEFVIAKV